MTLQTPGECPRCGGGFPGDVEDEKVCQCGSAWSRQEGRRRERQALRATAPRAVLKRTSGLKQTGGLKRTTPIGSGARLAAKSTAKPRPKKKADDIPPAVRAIVLARCQGMCESCGGTLEGGPVHMHHRQKRNKRNHTPCNIVALHPLCHVTAPLAVHQRPAWAQKRGLIVLSGGDPATTPLQLLPSGKLVLLDPVEPRYLPLGENVLPYAPRVKEAS